MFCPVALLASSLRNTPRCSTLGIIFSMPMQAMWTGVRCTPISALPSLVQTTKPPDSAIPKFTPVMAASAPRNFSRRWPRAASVRYWGSSAPSLVPIFSWKISPISFFFKWMAGITIWLGGCPRNWTMRSPKSVSTIS